MNIGNIIKYLSLSALLVYQLMGLESMVARGMLAVILLMVIISVGEVFGHMRRPVVNGIFFLLALNTLYWLISPKIIAGTLDWNTTGFFANTGMNLGIFFIAYYLTINREIKTWDMQVFFILLFIVTAIRFVMTRDLILVERNGHMQTMNMAYDFVIFMPYLFLFRCKIVPVLFLLPSLYFVMYGGKRGAILIYLLAAAFIVYHFYLRNVNRNQLIWSLAVIFVLCYIGIIMSINIFENSELLQYRLEQTADGNSNGRDTIYGLILAAWFGGNFFQLIFGFGFCASVRFAGNYAHNDWLELLSTAGLLGVVSYLLFFLQLFDFSKRKVLKGADGQVLLLICFIWFLRSFFSMAYCSVGSMPMTFLCGYIVGKQVVNNKVERIKKSL